MYQPPDFPKESLNYQVSASPFSSPRFQSPSDKHVVSGFHLLQQCADFSPQMSAVTVPDMERRFLAVAATVVRAGSRTETSVMIARVSITDYRGNVILDTYVHPIHPIHDYRTRETNISYTVTSLADTPHIQDVKAYVANIIGGKILVGHTLWIFLSVLGLSHPALWTRDLALFRPLRKKLRSKKIVPLSTLVEVFMGRKIGLDYEDSLENARASLDLFRSCSDIFERKISEGGWPYNLPPPEYANCYT